MIDNSKPPVRRARGRPTASDGEATRRSLLLAAMDEFASVGYGGASLRDLASAADLTTGTLYHYYPSKAALFCAAFDFALDEIHVEYEAAVVGAQSIEEELAAILRTGAVVLKKRPTIANLVLRAQVEWQHPDLRDLPVPFPDRARRFRDSMVDRVRARQELDERGIMLLRHLFPAMLWGLTAMWASDPRAGQRSMEAFVAVLDGGVRRLSARSSTS